VRADFGANSVPVANELANLGHNLMLQKKWAEAEVALRECLAIRQQQQPEAWTTFNTQSVLGGALLGLMKYADAEPLLLQGLEGLKQRAAKLPAAGAARLVEAEGRVADLFEATREKQERKLEGELTDAKAGVSHELPLSAGKPVVILMESKAFDTYLKL